MGRQLDGLRSAGLLNEEWSYLDIVAEQKSNINLAFCSSRRCHGDRMTGGTPKFDIPKDAIDCPDCRHALQWKFVTYQQFENLRVRGR